MENDFDGENQSLNSDPDQDEKGSNSKIDEEFSQVDEDNLDQKMWDNQSED